MTTPITTLVNIEVEEGTEYDLQITYTDPSTGLPVDITNYTSELIVESDRIDGTGSLRNFSTTTGELSIVGTSGIVNINIPASATLGLGMFKGHYGLYITAPAPSNKKTKLAKGFFTVIASALP